MSQGHVSLQCLKKALKRFPLPFPMVVFSILAAWREVPWACVRWQVLGLHALPHSFLVRMLWQKCAEEMEELPHTEAFCPSSKALGGACVLSAVKAGEAQRRFCTGLRSASWPIYGRPRASCAPALEPHSGVSASSRAGSQVEMLEDKLVLSPPGVSGPLGQEGAQPKAPRVPVGVPQELLPLAVPGPGHFSTIAANPSFLS